MIKIYNIGRDASQCEIIIDDPSNITSGRHAVLKINSKGKYTIVDCSSNGTYVNGLRIEPGVETPVTRKDVISFAHVVNLDWDFIPKPIRGRRIAYSVVSAIVILAALAFGYFRFVNSPKGDTPPQGPIAAEQKDTTTANPIIDKPDTVTVKKAAEKPKAKQPAKKKTTAKKTADSNNASTTKEVPVEKKVTNPIL
jgi:hypothetical protein